MQSMAQLKCMPQLAQLISIKNLNVGQAGKRGLLQQVVMSQLASCLAMTSGRVMKTFGKSTVHSPGKVFLGPHPVSYPVRCKATKCDDVHTKLTPSAWTQSFERPEPELDWTFLLSEENTASIAENIKNRKGVGDIHKVVSLAEQLSNEEDPESEEALAQELLTESLDIPNTCHPNTIHGDETCAKEVYLFGQKKEFDFQPWETELVGEKGLGMLRVRNMTFSHGDRTYYLEADLARLERALVNFTLDYLRKLDFEFVSVPDILYSDVVDSCGFKTNIDENAVYHIHPDCLPDSVLAGTSEMSLAGFFNNEVLHVEDLPVRMAAVSRCYRAEADGKAYEKGLYRVHHFTKVEMFGLAANEDGTESDDLLETFLEIQRDLFSQLGLHFRILDMPSQELGAPAYKKYDIESWMYAKKMWGEISSCSNCTDFQSRRLNIKYAGPGDSLKHVHTVNGTACAVPRLILSIIEQNQEKVSKYGRRIVLPEVLHPYMDGQEDIRMEVRKSRHTFIKSLRRHDNKNE